MYDSRSVEDPEDVVRESGRLPRPPGVRSRLLNRTHKGDGTIGGGYRLRQPPIDPPFGAHLLT